VSNFNPLKAELNSICHLPAILGTHHILHVTRIRVKTQIGARAGVIISYDLHAINVEMFLQDEVFYMNTVI